MYIIEINKQQNPGM